MALSLKVQARDDQLEPGYSVEKSNVDKRYVCNESFANTKATGNVARVFKEIFLKETNCKGNRNAWYRVETSLRAKCQAISMRRDRWKTADNA